MSILVGIKAVSAAASTPNWLLCCILQTATLLGNDVWRQRQKKSEEEKWEETIPTTSECAHRLIMVVAVVLRPPLGPTLGF
jgi:hypothetical protein